MSNKPLSQRGPAPRKSTARVVRVARGTLRAVLDAVAAITALSWIATRLVRRSPLPIRGRVYNRLAGRRMARDYTTARCLGIRMSLDLRDDVQRAIYFELFERTELDHLRGRIRSGDVCMDVGANIGFLTCHLARWVGDSGRVHAFEPEPRNIERLRANVELNALTPRVTVHPVALSDRRGTASFNRAAEGHSGWGSLNRYEEFHGDRIEVDTDRVDAVMEDRGVTELALLKVDVEGADLAVYRGAECALGRRSIRLVMAEWNGVWFPGQGWSFRDFTRYFEAFGYGPIGPQRSMVESLECGEIDAANRIINVIFERSRPLEHQEIDQ